MTASSKIREYIEGLPEGKPFSTNKLREFASTDNIRQFLNRLVKAGKIKRVTRGIFVKPKQNEYLGEILPNAYEIAHTLSKSSGEIITVHGAEAARILRLTTQVPMQLIFYTSGTSRILKLGNTKVKLKHVSPCRLVASGTKSGLVIGALQYLGRESVTINTVEKIKATISENDFNEIFELIDKMPAWMADIFYHYQKRVSHD